MIIGLTGNIGSGKSVVSHIFQILKIPVFFADNVGRVVLNDPVIFPKLKILFGTGIFENSNIPNRKKIAEIVFSTPNKLKKLNDIIHPEVTKRFIKWTEINKENPYVIMESAIIFENHLEYLFDKIIMVSADEETRIKRVMQRDHCKKEDVISRMKNQFQEDEKINRSDFIIKNNNFEPIIPQILSLHNLLIS